MVGYSLMEVGERGDASVVLARGYRWSVAFVKDVCQTNPHDGRTFRQRRPRIGSAIPLLDMTLQDERYIMGLHDHELHLPVGQGSSLD